nr:hypothetical protein [Pseudoxanthomonas sp.]
MKIAVAVCVLSLSGITMASAAEMGTKAQAGIPIFTSNKNAEPVLRIQQRNGILDQNAHFNASMLAFKKASLMSYWAELGYSGDLLQRLAGSVSESTFSSARKIRSRFASLSPQDMTNAIQDAVTGGKYRQANQLLVASLMELESRQIK